jgi:hypothetical protein
LGLYLVTRTSGIPWFGPEAGTVEAVGAIDIVSKVLEGSLILMLMAFLMLERRPAST